MAGRTGKAFVVQMGDAASPEVFNTVGGARQNGISLSNPAVDASDKDSTWRGLQANAANLSGSVSGSGRAVVDNATFIAMRTAFLAGTIKNFRIVAADAPSTGYSGAFQITAFEETGADGDVQLYSFTLESSDAVSYGALA